MVPIVLLSKKLATLVDFAVDSWQLPVGLSGILIALLVLAPEGVSALKAALANQLQRSVNICLGSSLSTIGMTVPAVVAIALITDQKLVLACHPSP